MQKRFSVQVVLVVGVVIVMLFPTLSQADAVNDLKDIGFAMVLPSEEFVGVFPVAPGAITPADAVNGLVDIGSAIILPAEDFIVDFPSVPEIGLPLLQPVAIESMDDTSQDNSANEVRYRHHRHNSHRRSHSR